MPGELSDTPRVALTSVDAATESKVEDRLAAMNALLSEGKETTESAETEPAASSVETESAEETPAKEPAEKEEKPEGEEAETEKVSTLPAAYRRSLKAYGWEDEEIEVGVKSGGDPFFKTAERIHATRNKEVQAFAEAGRRAKETPAAQQAPADDSLKPVDIKELTDIMGDGALAKKIADPLNQAIERINKIMPGVKSATGAAEAAKLEAFTNQVDTFFTGNDKEVYGTKTGLLTQEQYDARQKVLELADRLVAGATSQGKSLYVNEALQMAYDFVASPTKVTAARAGIKKEIVTRNKAISSRPSSRGSTYQGAKPLTSKQMEDKVANGLRKAFASS